MKILFTKKLKQFTNPDNGQKVDYDERNIVIDGIAYKINKVDGKVFDYQFADLINKD